MSNPVTTPKVQNMASYQALRRKVLIRQRNTSQEKKSKSTSKKRCDAVDFGDESDKESENIQAQINKIVHRIIPNEEGVNYHILKIIIKSKANKFGTLIHMYHAY